MIWSHLMLDYLIQCDIWYNLISVTMRYSIPSDLTLIIWYNVIFDTIWCLLQCDIRYHPISPDICDPLPSSDDPSRNWVRFSPERKRLKLNVEMYFHDTFCRLYFQSKINFQMVVDPSKDKFPMGEFERKFKGIRGNLRGNNS